MAGSSSQLTVVNHLTGMYVQLYISNIFILQLRLEFAFIPRTKSSLSHYYLSLSTISQRNLMNSRRNQLPIDLF